MIKQVNKSAEDKNMYVITIDGPAGSGKSTIAKIVAEKLNIAYINSGEAYRAIAFYMQANGIAPTNTTGVKLLLESNDFTMGYSEGRQFTKINGIDITDYLHSNNINSIVSQYAKIPEVIYKASEMIQSIPKDSSVVIEGRNVGSFCFPNADYKFFIDCEVKIRAKRRFDEMIAKGENVDFDAIYKQIIERDVLDRTRKIAPLIVPENSVLIDTSCQTPDQVAQTIVDIVLDYEKNK